MQPEVLRNQIRERFGLEVEFDAGSIVYRETIAEPVEGVGHYEPLRHYAEVHVLLEPGPPGSGLSFGSACSLNDLDRNWQRLILTHLAEKEHLGVLTGSPITDLRITLLSGRAHLKHTEGGDFRQATYRAIRQGLMQAKSILLEPFYRFTLEVPAACVGRAMSDLERMGAQYDPPETGAELTLLTGTAPVAALRGYALEVAAYSRGLGRISMTGAGYAPCRSAQEVIEAIGYGPGGRSGQYAGFCFLRPRRGLRRALERGAAAHAPAGGLCAPGPGGRRPAPPGPCFSRSAVDDKELEAIFTPHLWRPPAPRPLLPPPPALRERCQRAGRRGQRRGVFAGGWLQHPLRLGRAEGHRPAEH